MGALTVITRTLDSAVTKALPRMLTSVIGAPAYGIGAGSGGWMNVIREPWSGAWQANRECRPETLMAYSAVFACVTLISSDIAKLCWKLEREDDPKNQPGIYTEAYSASFSPVLQKPNHYQTHIQFKEQWQNSLSRYGNTFVLKRRDNRGVVTELFILDPQKVWPLIATDGSIFYQLSAELLVDVQEAVIVPASEIIHDRINCLFHPLIGLSPMFAAALSAGLGIEIERNSASFFANGAKISGIITAPGAIGDAAAKQVAENFNRGYTKENAGKVAVLGDGLKFQQLTMSSTDAQLIEILKKTAEDVCSVFHVPAYMVGFGPTPPYNNIEALSQQYYQQCLQARIESMELLIDEGLAIPDHYSVCLDLDGLLRMDTATQYATLGTAVDKTLMTPNEARARLGLPAVPGGDALYKQVQNYSLEALAKRDAQDDPFATSTNPSDPAKPAAPAEAGDPDPAVAQEDDDAAKAAVVDHAQVAAFTKELFAMILHEAELEHG